MLLSGCQGTISHNSDQLAVRHLALEVVHQLVLIDEHRIVAAHRGRAAVLEQVGRVQRVRVPVGHRDQLLLSDGAPRDEALVRA